MPARRHKEGIELSWNLTSKIDFFYKGRMMDYSRMQDYILLFLLCSALHLFSRKVFIILFFVTYCDKQVKDKKE